VIRWLESNLFEEDYKEVLVVWSGLGYSSSVGLEKMNRAVPVRIESLLAYI
jgi:hypothetical protein